MHALIVFCVWSFLITVPDQVDEIVSIWLCRHGRCKRGVGNRGGLPRTKIAIPTAILVVTGNQGKSITGKHAQTFLANSQMTKILTNPLPPLLYNFISSFTLLSSQKAPPSLSSCYYDFCYIIISLNIQKMGFHACHFEQFERPNEIHKTMLKMVLSLNKRLQSHPVKRLSSTWHLQVMNFYAWFQLGRVWVGLQMHSTRIYVILL